jgi:hypothetical protein
MFLGSLSRLRRQSVMVLYALKGDGTVSIGLMDILDFQMSTKLLKETLPATISTQYGHRWLVCAL